MPTITSLLKAVHLAADASSAIPGAVATLAWDGVFGDACGPAQAVEQAPLQPHCFVDGTVARVQCKAVEFPFRELRTRLPARNLE